MSKQPVQVFISYAHKDEDFKDQLNRRLKYFERNEIIKVWDDRDILPGQDWHGEISEALENADIALFLISPDFIYSDYIDSNEVKRAMELHDEKSLVLIPLMIRPSNLSRTVLGRFQAIPKGAKPITSWDDTDSAWLNVENQLEKTFTAIREGTFGLKRKQAAGNGASNNSSGAGDGNNNTKVDLDAIQALVGSAKLEEAIQKMMEVTAGKYSDMHNQLIMQSSRLSQLKRNETMGMIGFSEAGMVRAQITNATLSILSDLRKEL
ncbi:MAG: TIR domain-containing protein [Bacteroidota bacterium]